MGLTNLEIIPSAFAENLPKNTLSPFEYVMKTAAAKAIATYTSELEASAAAASAPGQKQKGDPELIIAADTIVVGPNGIILEKPRSEKHHLEMLKLLRDGAGPSNLRGQYDETGLGLGAEMLELGSGIRGEGAVMGNSIGARGKGHWHKVFTAVSILAPLESARDPGYALETTVEETGVLFDSTSKFSFA